MVGDNLYGSDRPIDYEKKFERPYKTLLDARRQVLRGARQPRQSEPAVLQALQHERPAVLHVQAAKASVRFFALDSNYMDKEQLDWLEKELAASGSDWKIATSTTRSIRQAARHGSDETLREQLEPLFVKHGVNVVVAGHEHFYERIKPQKGIYYFVSGGAAKLRAGDIERSPMTAKGFDSGYHFMLWEIAGDALHFQVISEEPARRSIQGSMMADQK